MSLVSIIIPTHNRAHLISETIDSVLAQTYKDFEIIVVDDGSTDNTKEVLSKYNEEIRYLYQENKKMPAAKNLGIKEVKGKYIAFLDSDDLWLPEKLELQVKILDNRPDVGLVHSDGCWFNERCVVITSQFRHLRMYIPSPDDYLRNLFLNRVILVSSSVIIRKSCFEKVGLYDERFITNSDFDMQCRIARHFNIEFIDKVLVKTRLGNQDKMSEDNERLYKYKLMAMGKIANLYPEVIQGYTLRKGFANTYFNLGSVYFSNNKFKEAKQSFLESIKNYSFNVKKYFYFVISLIKSMEG